LDLGEWAGERGLEKAREERGRKGKKRKVREREGRRNGILGVRHWL